MKQSIKINIPEGMEIDEENSTFNEIVFKLLENKVIKSWKALETIEGYYLTTDSEILLSGGRCSSTPPNKNIFVTEKQVQSSLAMAQLSHLMKQVNGDWEPDWNNGVEPKYVIRRYRNAIETDCYNGMYHFLSFKNAVSRNLFIDNHKTLIQEYFMIEESK